MRASLQVMRLFSGWAGLLLLLAACSPAAGPAVDATADPGQGVSDATAAPGSELPAWAPHPGDDALERGAIFLYVAQVQLQESDPVQARLHLSGALPSPCHQLRAVIAAPDADNRIVVDVYTVVDSGQDCAQAMEAFDQSLPLGSYPAGDYTVIVNGVEAAKFTI
jgi:hypothetical protein